MESETSFLKKRSTLYSICGICIVTTVVSLAITLRVNRLLPISKIFNIYAAAWQSVTYKLDEIRFAKEQNERLKLENANLRLSMEKFKYESTKEGVAEVTKRFQEKLERKTGAKAGREIASLTYKPPTGLLPSQLYTLGLTYLKAHEDEKAAVILTYLMGLESGDSFRTAKNLLITGLAWYRLENFTMAEEYFDEVLKKPQDLKMIQYQAQARLWKSVLAKRLNKDVKSQYWLRELIDHHPHAPEAKWVNSEKNEDEEDDGDDHE